MATRSCAACTIELTFFKRKICCHDCRDIFCTKCATSVSAPGITKGRRCFKCRTFAQPNRTDLMTLKVPDLKNYLTVRDVSMTRCTEKKDLVDLILQFASTEPDLQSHNSSRTTSSSSTPRSHRSVHDTDRESRNWTDRQRASPRSQPGNTTHQTTSPGQSQRSQSLPQTWRPPQTETPPQSGHSQRQAESPSQPGLSETQSQASQSSRLQSPLAGQVRMRASLDDLTTEDDIDNLTVLQLKGILARNFVDYKGCIEKSELISLVRHLFISHQKEKGEMKEVEASGYAGSNNPVECKICMDQPIDCVLLECGHMVCCTGCGKRLAECPVCRKLVSRVVRVFRP